nr:MAG: ORF1 [Torque teno midi virus]
MAFWWARRRRYWYGPRRQRRYRKYKTRTTKYRRRRRPRRFAGRRRRRYRKTKVRRKRKLITVKQYQPDSIRKCKIRGVGFLVAGAQGSQFHCYTNQKDEYTQARAPGGGGFGVEVFTLEYLFKQWEAHKNIWTASNDYKELVRYTGCKFIFFPHPTTDFILSYDRQPPFEFDKHTYLHTHPQHMFLTKHHRVLKSIKYSPYSRKRLKLKIKPPKLMQTKWFFQPDFADVPLVKLQASAMNLGHSLFGPNTQSTNINIFALNTNFYQRHNWAQNTTPQPYMPYNGYPSTSGLYYLQSNGQRVKFAPTTYTDSVNISKGFFNKQILNALQVSTTDSESTKTFERPVTIARYNPEEDTGVGNAIWLTSVVSNQGWVTPSDLDLIITEQPLYIAVWGFWDWIKQKKGKDTYFDNSMFVVRCKAIKTVTPSTQTVWPLIDPSFMQGKLPYDELITKQKESLWYPTCYNQVQTLNALVECGPYTPKYSNLPDSTWNLPYIYTFYFKWGGQNITDQLIQDPKAQEKYPVPNHLLQTIQVADPRKQHTENILKTWDFRRGYLTSSAIKRIQENLQLDDSEQSDTETPQKKRKVTSELQCQNQEAEEIQTCLHSLFEKDSFPEEEDNLKQLIYKQYQQQQKLKHNLINFLMYLKKKQRHLQLQAGLP